MARVLIVGGGCRGLRLAADLAGAGHAVRITTRSERTRPAIEATGAECWVGTPDRIGTLRFALDGVAIACWLLGTARGDQEQVRALHGSRLEFMLSQLIDTTVRGLVYEAAGTVDPEVLAGGARMVRKACALHSIPLSVIETPPGDDPAWLTGAQAGIDRLLGVSKPSP
jgi:glycine/D-amino acid oxidase-like deaminating enzyme